MNTRLDYTYRDAHNYKQHASVVLRGRLSAAEVEPCLIDGLFFIPELIGLPPLQELFDDYPVAADHQWHELDGLTPTTDHADHGMVAVDIRRRFQRYAKQEFYTGEKS